MAIADKVYTLGIRAVFYDSGLAAGLSRSQAAINRLQMGVATGMGAVATASVIEAKNFQRSVNEILAIGGKDFLPFMDDLRESARSLGRDSEFKAEGVAEGFRAMAQAGVEPTQMLRNISPLMEIARLGMVDLARATEMTLAPMKMFHLDIGDPEEVRRVGDYMAKASNLSFAEIPDLTQSLKMMGQEANLLGFSLEDSLFMVTMLGTEAIKSGTAGVQMMNQLQHIGEKLDIKYKGDWKELGVDIFALQDMLNKQDMKGVITTIIDAMDNLKMKPYQKGNTVMDILGDVRGMRGFLTLGAQIKSGKWDQEAEKYKQSMGSLAFGSAALANDTEANLKRFESAWSDLKITAGDIFLPDINRWVKGLTERMKSASKEGKDSWLMPNEDTLENAFITAGGIAASRISRLLLSHAGGWGENMSRPLAAMFGSAAMNTAGGSFGQAAGLIGAAAGTVFGAGAAFAMGYEFGVFIDNLTGWSNHLAELLYPQQKVNAEQLSAKEYANLTPEQKSIYDKAVAEGKAAQDRIVEIAGTDEELTGHEITAWGGIRRKRRLDQAMADRDTAHAGVTGVTQAVRGFRGQDLQKEIATSAQELAAREYAEKMMGNYSAEEAAKLGGAKGLYGDLFEAGLSKAAPTEAHYRKALDARVAQERPPADGTGPTEVKFKLTDIRVTMDRHGNLTGGSIEGTASNTGSITVGSE